MSGTSADGIDAVAARIAWSSKLPRVELREHKAVPFTEHQREQILRAVSGAATVPELALLHGTLGDLYAEGAMGLARGRGAAVIGLHGQTVAHLPASRVPLQIAGA